ncbi:hypothetical protein ACUY4Q_002953 [Phytobacter sp. AG2a]|jgi:hypothetical protein
MSETVSELLKQREKIREINLLVVDWHRLDGKVVRSCAFHNLILIRKK